ncbi:MAG TPA: Asp-tRNA(Asn)/Glu-tRNA(Gln) amidotransferase subunit GatC [Terracidiphilus sp.]|jgi:aspartyl-tRNA(Asn)/glutamyl-tRNA(Gln) amidotransferase subunit C
MSEVTKEDVLRVAELANLELTADEVPRMSRDLNAILGHIAQLSELDTAGVPAMSQVADVLDSAVLDSAVLDPALGAQPDLAGASLRPDVETPCLDRKAVMAAAPETDGRFFKVPKVIER